MLPFHLLLNLANGCFPRGLRTIILCTPCRVIIPTWLATQNINHNHNHNHNHLCSISETHQNGYRMNCVPCQVSSLSNYLFIYYTRNVFNVHGSVHRKNILIYIQRDATLHSLFYLETALHVSGGIITRHQERKQLYLQHLVFVTPLLLPAASGR